jgi:predicted amidohydrolase
MVESSHTAERIRVASLQYFIRPVQKFEQFRDQVEALLETAADYDCDLEVFPEYFTVQLVTLGTVKRPIREQIGDRAKRVPAGVSRVGGLGRGGEF